MAKIFTDLSDVFDKVDNTEAKSEIETSLTPDNEYLDAEQWNRIGTVIDELKDAVNDLDDNTVKGIKQGVTTYYPDDNIVSLPGADSQVNIFTNLSSNKIVSITGKLEVGLRATSVVGGSNTGEVVTVTVMTAPQGSTDWSQVGTFSMNTKAYNSEEYETKDLSEFISQGTFDVQLVATGQRTGVTGYSDTFTSTLTNMYLTCAQNYQTPIDTANFTYFPVAYTVYGTVSKTLHVKIQGSVTTETYEYEIGSDVDSTTVRKSVLDDTAHGYLTHGVHCVEAWLSADDGQGNTIESDHLVNRFMVINRNTSGADMTKPYILLQNIVGTATNFVQTKLCDYAVYSPSVDEEGNISYSGENVDVVFLVTAYAQDYLTEQPEEYFRMENSITPGTTNSLNVTVEIEAAEGLEESTSYNSYFRVYRNQNDVLTDMMTDAMGVSSTFVSIDNSDSFAPMSGADFVLNPKVRNNTESNPERILNARKNNAVVESTWTNFGFINDGWMTNSTDNQKVLRIPAGSKINIKYNPFSQFLTTADSSMTLELDFAVRNMTDETEQIIGINEYIEATGKTIGLIIRPIQGIMYTASNVVESESDFGWQEDKRVHVAINIHNSLEPDKGDAYEPTADTGIDTTATNIALIRVFINGNIEREMKYSITNTEEFTTADAYVDGDGEIQHGIVLGSSSADLDVYSIRCYKSMQLEADDVQDNWIASLPTSAEKIAARKENSLKVSGKINVEKVKALGKRVLIWHGDEPYYYAADAQKGWWEIFQYNDDGTMNRDLSGTICKETKSLSATRQGSTANTYYYSNLQTKLSDVEDTITVAVSSLHSSITVGTPYEEVDSSTGEKTGKMYVPLKGGNLGKNFPLPTESTVDYEYYVENAIAYVVVPDGWIDGNNLYRGVGYMVAEGTPLAQKLVNKINYASSMQSHLPGCTRAYSDLHTAVVGKNSLQEAVSNARVAKFNLPFYFFVQGANDSTPVFRGPCSFGAGKMDKPTWGYVKSANPMFMMVEGSDNNYTMTDFRCPWDHNVTYSPSGEGWMRNKLQHWDFDAGKTDKFNEDTADEYEVPKNNLTELWKNVCNFNYLHAPMLSYYVGTFVDFTNSSRATETTKKFWCTEGSEAFHLKRYDEVQLAWVDAGLETGSGTEADPYKYEVVDLTTDTMTAATYTASDNKSNFAALNEEFISAIVAHWKKYLAWYMKPSSVRFHYCFINHLMAGTDNCSKNTYFVSDPVSKTIEIDGVSKTVYQFEMHQDDVDTIGPTDNNGRSTKPYYIDRMHPYADTDTSKSTALYEGMNNVFFNLCELAFEGTLELQSTMQKIFDAMGDAMSTNTDTLIDFDGSANNTVWGFFYKYFFNIQHYFSCTAYNEAARIRYEYPAMINYTSRGPGARGIAPITQSMGPQMQREIQYFHRRLILFASYADWGDFYDGGKTHKLGISEAADSFPLQAYHLPDSGTSENTYAFTLVAHQYIYPTGVMGQSPVDPHVRVAPGETYKLTLGTTTSNDTGMSVLGINYYKSIGNIGDISVSPDLSITINGKRLVEFIAEPSKTYTDMTTGAATPAFRPGSISITATRLKTLSLNGCTQTSGSLNCSSLTRLETLDIRNTNISTVTYPSSTTIKNVYLGSKVTSVTLKNMPNLANFDMDSYANLLTFIVDTNSLGSSIDTLYIASKLYEATPAKLNTVQFIDVNWPGSSSVIPLPAMIYWMYEKNAKLSGVIDSTGTDTTYSFAQKVNLVNKYGDVDNENNSLYLKYKVINISRLNITGDKYIYEALCTANADGSYAYDKYSVTCFPSNGNNIAISDGHIDATWSLTTNPYATVSDATTGALKITSFSSLDITHTLTVTVNTISGSSLSNTATVGFYRRTPKLGDFAYLDGSFDDAYDSTKDLAGIVYARQWYKYNPDEDLPTGVTSNPALNYKNVNNAYSIDPDANFLKLYIVSKEYMSLKTSDKTATPISSSMRWGLYNESSSGSNGFSTDELSAMLGRINTLSGQSYTSMFDVANLPNITATPVYQKDGNMGWYAYADHIQADMTSETDYENGGFRAKNMPNNSGCSTSLADWNGKSNTATIANWVETMIQTYMSEQYGSMNPPETLEELADYMYNILRTKMAADNTNKDKYYEFAYPAAYACYLYQPTVTQGIIDDLYKVKNWYLPGIGELTRMYHHFNISRQSPMTSSNTSSNSNTPNATYANYASNYSGVEGVDYTTLDAWNPIFAKAYERIATAGGSAASFGNIGASGHWSSAEYSANLAWGLIFDNSGVYNGYSKCSSASVRPVVAYTYTL